MSCLQCCTTCVSCDGGNCGASTKYSALVDRPPHVDGFTCSTFTHAGAEKLVYSCGTGPGIVVIHEMPGFIPPVAAFALKLASAGFRVECPIIFGEVMRPFSAAYIINEIGRGCVRKEFAALAGNVTAPITDWLRAFAADLHKRVGGKAVGALGMCFTARYALGMLLEPCVSSAVLSQPGNPMAMTAKGQRELGLSPADAATISKRAAAGACAAMGLRFSEDFAVKRERFEALRDLLGDHFIDVTIDSRSGNPHGISTMAHSVLTVEFKDEPGHPTRAAFDRVVGFYAERLERPPLGGPGGGAAPSTGTVVTPPGPVSLS